MSGLAMWIPPRRVWLGDVNESTIRDGDLSWLGKCQYVVISLKGETEAASSGHDWWEVRPGG